MTINADLHCHSIFSDGTLTPEALAERAVERGVALWSLTDHDTLDGQKRAQQAAQQLRLNYCYGVEISVTWAEQTLHILGLNIDPECTLLINGLNAIRAERMERAKKIALALEKVGITNAYQKALSYASHPESISRTHFARYLVDIGICSNISEVFKRYLGQGCPAYIPLKWASLAQAIQWIKAAQGVAVIAHPGRYPLSLLQKQMLFDEFKNLGGLGIEVITGNHQPYQYHEYTQIALQYGFLASRGSDFHSPQESYADLGSLPALPTSLTPIWHHWPLLYKTNMA